MKKIAIKLSGAFVILFLISMSACKKSFLDLQPKGSTNESTLATKPGVNGLLMGAYNYLGNGWLYASDYLWAEVPSDEANFGSYGTASWGMECFTLNASFFLLEPKWNSLYYGVQRSNDVLRVLAKVPDGLMSDDEKLQVKGEAMFLRGYYHMQLTNVYGNVPYLDETMNYESGNYNVSNTDPVWPKIEADFQFAADNLSESKPAVGSANKWAAKSFLAKVFMFEHKFPEAKTLLDDIIASGKTSDGKKYGLTPKYFDTYNPAMKNSEESVFAIQCSVNDGSGGDNGNVKNGLAYTGPYGGPVPTYGWLQPSQTLANSYKTDEVTGLPLIYTFNDNNIKSDQGILSSEPFTPETGTLDPRLDWVMGRRGIPFLDWGINPGNNWIPSQLVSGPYIMIKSVAPQSQPDASEGYSKAINETLIRFADVLLWAAEVEVEIGSLPKAEEYVNLIRARAANPAGFVHTYIDDNDPLKGSTNTPAANYKVGLYNGEFAAKGQTFARDAVRFETLIETAMENRRFFTLQRWDHKAGEPASGYMADVINASLDHEVNHVPGFLFEGREQFLAGQMFKKGINEIQPIPQSQIDISTTADGPTLKQNPGY